MEIEEQDQLLFLNVFVYQKEAGLVHNIYRKPTHTNLYLNARSLHHPEHQKSVLSILVHTAKMTSDKNSLPEEFEHLQGVFLPNGYSTSQSLMAKKISDPETDRKMGQW